MMNSLHLISKPVKATKIFLTLHNMTLSVTQTAPHEKKKKTANLITSILQLEEQHEGVVHNNT